MSDYVLRGGEQGAARLKLLTRVKWPTTKTLLRRAGLREGMRCLDVGCGNGAVTVAMARRVGVRGQAVGIDQDEKILDTARQLAARRKVQATFRKGSALDIGETAKFDLVFARYILTHLRDPALALAEMKRAVRPGGIVVVEDIDFPGHFCHPACPAYARYVELYQEVVRRRGGDAAIGPRLLGMFLDAGLEPVYFNVILPAFHEGEGKLLAAVTVEHIRESVVAEGLATNKEIDAIVAELEAFAKNPRTIMSMSRTFQICGTLK